MKEEGVKKEEREKKIFLGAIRVLIENLWGFLIEAPN